MKPKKTWFDDMQAIWLSRKTVKQIQQLRLDLELKTADDVIEMLLKRPPTREVK